MNITETTLLRAKVGKVYSAFPEEKPSMTTAARTVGIEYLPLASHCANYFLKLPQFILTIIYIYFTR